MCAFRQSIFRSLCIICIVLIQHANLEKLIRRQRSIAQINVKTWANAIVPYFIKNPSNLANKSDTEFSDLDIQLIKKAMDNIETETCIKFKELNRSTLPKNMPYLEIDGNADMGCYSSLGVISDGKQSLYLDSTCRTVGHVMHELLHALGFMHEIMRPDRDKHVLLHRENIQEAYLQEFDKIEEHQAILWDREFDFQSISLYDPFTFTSNGNQVWEPLHSLTNIPLFSLAEKDLSFEDSAGLNRLYKCDANCSKGGRQCKKGEFKTKDCTCRNKEYYAYERCKDDLTQKAYCKDAVIKNKCYDESKYAIPYCRKTCGRCFRAGRFGTAPPPKKLCQDLDQALCPKYVKEGYCHFDSWTKMNCQKSCDLCPPQQIADRQVETADVNIYLEAFLRGKCFNRYDDLKCEIFAQRGECQSNPGFMTSQCTQSCKLCKTSDSGDKFYLQNKVAPCRNYIDDERCDALAREGKCRGTTLKQCLGSCNQCGTNYTRQVTASVPITTQQPIKPSECKDQSSMCSMYLERGECLSHSNVMRLVCPRSCGFCEPECADIELQEVCEDYVRRGYCNAALEYAKRCAESCGLCKDPSLLTSVSSPEILKWNTNTTPLSSTNEENTKTKSTTVKETTKVEPRTTRTGTTPRPVIRSRQITLNSLPPDDKCVDHFPSHTCWSWVRAGYCNFPHVSKLCSKSCYRCETNRLFRYYRSFVPAAK